MQRSVEEVRAGNPRVALSSREAAYAVLLLAAVSLLWLFDLLIMASIDVALDEIPAIVVFCLAIVALQAVLLFALRTWGALIFTLFAVVNTYSLYIVFAEQDFWVVYLVIIMLSLAALYFVLLQIVLFARRLRPWIFAALYLAVALTGLLGILPLMREATLAGADGGLKNIRILDFKRKPNLYFLGFDALMPQALTRKLLQIDRPAYFDVIARHGGKVIPNLFADQVPTKQHWSRVMTIVPYKGKNEHYLLGARRAALPETLRHNGYETHFSYANGYFGSKKGPLLTTYAYQSPYSTCKFLHGSAEIYGLLGYCALLLADWLGPVDRSATLDAFYMDRLRVATRADKSKPQFFAAHYPKPDHAKSHNGTKQELDDYRRDYQAGSVMAATMMDRMLTEIRSADPTAIVLIFGDHGPLIKRGGHERYREDPEGTVQSRHGILGAVFGADECMKFMLPKAGTRSQTFAQVEVGLLQCLSGGTSPLRQDVDFGKIIQGPGLRFEDYGYE